MLGAALGLILTEDRGLSADGKRGKKDRAVRHGSGTWRVRADDISKKIYRMLVDKFEDKRPNQGYSIA